MDLGSLSLLSLFFRVWISVILFYFLRDVGGSRERERKGARRVGGKSDSAIGTDDDYRKACQLM